VTYWRSVAARSGAAFAGGLLLAVLLAVLVAACSESGDAGPGGSGAGAGGSAGQSNPGGAGAGGSAGQSNPGGGALAACRAFCAKEEDCDPETTLAECETATCVNPVNPSQALVDSPPDCQDALAAYWTCLSEASDPCNQDSCPAASDAVVSACF
jgi:hypothetical protein